jgi:3D (Asp-Asp-Asp) domain-containing protein
MRRTKHNILIYLFTKTLKNKSLILVFALAAFTTLCLPLISSRAYYFATAESPLIKIQKRVALALEPRPEVMKLFVTAYSSTSGETDHTPCLSATAYNLCKHNVENVVACNFLPFGTKIKFPQLDPNKFYTVVDRMHERYNSRIDIWMQSHQEAEKFGIKYLTVEIYR